MGIRASRHFVWTLNSRNGTNSAKFTAIGRISLKKTGCVAHDSCVDSRFCVTRACRNARNHLIANGTTLKELAKHLGLTKGTVSAVLNDSPYAKAIPQHTKDRIFAAALELNYHPNFFARTLRKKRTYTVGVICAEIGDAYGSVVISGIEAAAERAQVFLRDGRASSRSAIAAPVLRYSADARLRGLYHHRHHLADQIPELPTVADFRTPAD